ncbi:MAG: hypothetical protein ACO4CW_14660 [Planctomycetota bacterium]
MTRPIPPLFLALILLFPVSARADFTITDFSTTTVNLVYPAVPPRGGPAGAPEAASDGPPPGAPGGDPDRHDDDRAGPGPDGPDGPR